MNRLWGKSVYTNHPEEFWGDLQLLAGQKLEHMYNPNGWMTRRKPINLQSKDKAT